MQCNRAAGKTDVLTFMAFSVPLLSAKLAMAYEGILPGTLYLPGSQEPGRLLVSTVLLPYCSVGAGRI